MGSVWARCMALVRSPHGRRMFRYTMVSVISTLVSQGVLFALYGLAQLWTGVIDNIIANAVATVPSYYLNRSWAWGKAGRSHWMREVLPFWALSFAGMALSIGTVSLAEHLGKELGMHHVGLTILVQGANLSAFGLLWVVKFLVFNRLFQVEPPAEEPELVRA